MERPVRPRLRWLLIALEAIIIITLLVTWLFWSISSESPSKFIYYNF